MEVTQSWTWLSDFHFHFSCVRHRSSMLAVIKTDSILVLLEVTCCCCCCWVTLVVSDSVWPIDGSPPGSPVPGILQAGTLEWVAISFSNAWKWKVKVKSLSRVLTLGDHMDCSLPGSSVHGIFQARVLEWVATAFSELPADGAENETS